MIPITDRHLREACGRAIEQDIAEFASRPCTHCFSEDFRESIQQIQEKTVRKRPAKFSPLRARPFRRFLPAAAVIALVCLAGYRLLDLAPFRMGSARQGYGETAEEPAENFAAGAEDSVEYGAETAEAAEGAARDSEEVPGGTMSGESAGEESGSPDTPAEKEMILEDADAAADDGGLPESEKNKSRADAIKLLSITYYASTRTLALELQNNSDETVDLENKWMLFNSEGDTVNMNTDSPELSNPPGLLPRKTAVLRCILPDGELPEGEYTLELDDGKTSLTFVFP